MTNPTLNDILLQTLYSEFIDKVQLEELVAFNELVTELKDQFRVYLASPEVVASHLWPVIRRNETIFNLIMRLSMNFYFRLEEHDKAELFESAIANMARAYEGMELMKDNDLVAKTVKGTELTQLPGCIKFLFYCQLDVRDLIRLEAKVQGK